MLCGLADAVNSLEKLGVAVNRILLVGGAAKSQAVGDIASSIFGRTVLVPEPGEYVANGAAKQAAWALTGEIPNWSLGSIREFTKEPTPGIFERYKELVNKTENF